MEARFCFSAAHVLGECVQGYAALGDGFGRIPTTLKLVSELKKVAALVGLATARMNGYMDEIKYE